MVKLLTESSLLETHLKPYIDAANADSWKHVLEILYLNGSVLEAHENFRVPCLISRVGSIKKVEKSIDLLSGKSKARITPLAVKAAKLFLPKLLKSLLQAELTKNSDSEQLNTSAVNAIVNILPELERHRQTLMGMVIDGAFTMADLIAVWLFKGLSDMRDTHILSGIGENAYENMIDGLRKLDIVEPKLRVSICSECMNYELTISKCPSLKETCSKCGTSWTTLTLYMFETVLSDIKSENGDLPLFVSSYLRFKLSSQMLVGDVKIFPKAEVDYSDEGKEEDEPSKVEIDVYIPNFNIGIECKTFETPLAPMTVERANGIVGRLMKQLRKYVKAGISEFFLVTNIPEKRLGKIQQSFEVSLRNAQIPLNFKIIPGNVDSLLSFLDNLADRIAKHVWEGFEESLKKKVPKPVEEIEVIEALDQKKEDEN